MDPREIVVVAMSGGVDSSVAAAVLLQQGYQVIGMMLRLWNESGREDQNRCCTPDAMAQARRVAAILGIPFYVVDAKSVFYNTVVTSFLEGYAQGNTPNPCLVCNRHIRWEFLLQHALSVGARYLATGHYVRLGQNAQGSFEILRAHDHEKDQSYVLHVLNQETLSHAKFPIGEYPKSQVRQIAAELGLPVAHRPDSQDLCFLGDDGLNSFLVRNAPEIINPGLIQTRVGEILGQHQGLAFYTIGQRKGLGLSAPTSLYVIEKDSVHNVLIVGRQDELGKNELIAANVNWVSGSPPEAPFRAEVKIRYKAAPAWGIITPLENKRIYIRFQENLRDITPGQAAVIYKDEVCLGGGIIIKNERAV
jgi:tRNA-uridine 2-sulfurtransferase